MFKTCLYYLTENVSSCCLDLSMSLLLKFDEEAGRVKDCFCCNLKQLMSMHFMFIVRCSSFLMIGDIKKTVQPCTYHLAVIDYKSMIRAKYGSKEIITKINRYKLIVLKQNTTVHI